MDLVDSLGADLHLPVFGPCREPNKQPGQQSETAKC
jgi:hypothetical protein